MAPFLSWRRPLPALPLVCALPFAVSCSNEASSAPMQVGGDAGSAGAGGAGAGGAGAGGNDSGLSGLDARPLNPHCTALEDPPLLLSDHPCFEGSPPEPSEALVPYTVIAPLWSDAADKRRFVALPDDAAFEVRPTGEWVLPPGGVAVKEFRLEDRLETRLLTRLTDGEYAAFTYVWNQEGTDAERIDDGVIFSSVQGSWTVPSRTDCFECHTEAAGITLGLETQQLATSLTYPTTNRTADQLETLAFIGMLPPQSDVTPLPAYDDDNSTAAARAYLHSNCSHCHRPGAPGGGDMDLRFHVSLPNMGVCDVFPETGDPTPGQDGRLVVPGDIEQSILYLRLISEDSIWRMPPLGTEVVDGEGEQLIRAWINGLDDCP